MKKIKTIVRKEWAEVFKNRMVIFTVAFLPLLMTAIPLGIIYGTRGTSSTSTGSGANSALPTGMTQSMCPNGLSSQDCFQVFLVSEFMMLFMLVPVAIPVTIAAYSIVGEKTTRSLEPLLATPITTVELMVGKCLAAVIPAIIATYGAFGVFALGSWIIVANKPLLSALLDARWLVAIFIVGPLLAVMAVTFSLMISSRVNDPRVAEQVSMVVILPVLAGFFGQVAGLFVREQHVAFGLGTVPVDHDVDQIARLHGNLAVRREKLFDRNETFRFIPEIDDDFLIGDLQDAPFEDLPLRRRRKMTVVFEQVLVVFLRLRGLRSDARLILHVGHGQVSGSTTHHALVRNGRRKVVLDGENGQAQRCAMNVTLKAIRPSA